MDNWKLLSDLEYKLVWSRLYENFHFSPQSPKKEQRINLPKPSICFNIAQFYNEGFNEAFYDDLHESAIVWFKKVSRGKRMYALNWQHECYSFNANLPFEKDEFDEWLISIFPNGDYLFFLTSDFSNGVDSGSW